MPPIISVIVPVYKVEKYLNRCVDSILSQTFNHIEIILINDGSPDKCGEICNEYAKLDNRIKVVHKENEGLSSARNIGLSIAEGEYVAFVDSDDYIHPRMYEVLYKQARKHSSDIVICNYKDVYYNDYPKDQTINTQFQAINYTNIGALAQLYDINGVQFVIACNKLYRREMFDNLEYEKGRLHEDEFIAHKLLYRGKRITYVPVDLYYYLQRKEGIIRSGFSMKKLDAVEAYSIRIEFLRSIQQRDLMKKAEYSYVSLLFDYYFKVQKYFPDSKKELKLLRKDFCKHLVSLIRNPYFIPKEKVGWLLFAINPFLLKLFTK